MTTEITKQEMIETKKYAIKCSTQEQARECTSLGLIYLTKFITDGVINDYINNGYTIITYEEAVGLGLLGEKTLTITARMAIEKGGYNGELKNKEEVKEESNKIEELELIDFNLPDGEEMFDKINEIIRHLNK